MLRELEASRGMLLPRVPRGFSYRQVHALLMQQESFVKWDEFLDRLLMLRPETAAIMVLKDATLLVDCSLTKEWSGSLEELVGVRQAEMGRVRGLSLCGVTLQGHTELPKALAEGLVILNASACNLAIPRLRSLLFLNVSASGLSTLAFVTDHTFPQLKECLARGNLLGTKSGRACHLPETLKLLDISQNRIGDGLQNHVQAHSGLLILDVSDNPLA